MEAPFKKTSHKRLCYYCLHEADFGTSIPTDRCPACRGNYIVTDPEVAIEKTALSVPDGWSLSSALSQLSIQAVLCCLVGVVAWLHTETLHAFKTYPNDAFAIALPAFSTFSITGMAILVALILKSK